MNNKKLISRMLILAGVSVVVIIIALILFPQDNKEEKIKVGFVMSGSTTETGWNGLHYEGIKSACDMLEVELIVKEGIKENSGQCEEAIHELAKKGVSIIILSSYGYAGEVLDVVEEYKDIVFYSESFDYYGDNLNCYFSRIYQARYLAGIVAGMQTETGIIGYVAAMPNSEVNRGINAFALGAQRVNPNAKVVVAWSNSWDNSEEEKRLAEQLIDERDVDVITYHQNQPNVIKVAEERGIYSIAYHQVMEGASDKLLTTVEFHWDLAYKELVSDYLSGKSEVVNVYWFGLDKDAIGLGDMSPYVSQDTITLLEEVKQEIVNGERIFSGVIYDTEGNLRCDQGENISDQILMREMDWYVEGVEFYEE